MQRKWFEKDSFSFTVVDDNEFDFDESVAVENAKDIPSPAMSENDDDETNVEIKKRSITEHMTDSSGSGDEDNPKASDKDNTTLPQRQSNINISNAGPSKLPNQRIRSPIPQVSDLISSDSDSDDSHDGNKKKHSVISGEYDPSQYEELDVSDEAKELFQYITKYIPQNLNLDYKFKPFIPEYLPAVGDIDAFLKIIPPEHGPFGETFVVNQSLLGLTVLDEPAANQSDPALLHLQLRASSVHVSQTTDVVVKKVDNVEKNSKTIEKWIKDVSELHKSKSSPVVKYTDPMPDLDVLMQEWPEKLENTLKSQGFPSYKMKGSLSDYIRVVCCLFDIPVYKNKLQSLHLFFCLYAAVKNSQLYKATLSETKDSDNYTELTGTADQLVLD